MPSVSAIGLALAVAAAVAFVVSQVRTYVKNLLWVSGDVTTPGLPWPFVGHTYHFFALKPAEILPKLYELCLGSGETRKVAGVLGNRPILILYHPDTVQPILSSPRHLEKSEEYDFLLPWLDRGLLLSYGDKWRSRRKLLTPSFHFRILDDSMSVFNRHADALGDALQTDCDNGAADVDLFPYVTRCTLDVMLESSMGKLMNIQENRDSEYARAISDIVHLVQVRQQSPWLYSDFSFNLSSWKAVQDRCLKVLHGFTKQVIRERRREFEDEKDELSGRKRLAFLDLLLRTGSNPATPLSDGDLQEEVDTFLFEGHDTTACSLTWTLLLLAKHSEVQERCVEEQRAIFGDSDRGETEVATEHLNKMTYLDAVVKESLRLYPSVSLVGRRLREDAVVDGFKAPAGTSAICFIHLLHRNPEVWSDPNRFIPERFLPGSKEYEEVEGRHPYAYVPFSAGPRNCIGQKFAQMEEKTVLSKLLRRLRLRKVTDVDEVRPVIEIITRPEGEVRVSAEPR